MTRQHSSDALLVALALLPMLAGLATQLLLIEYEVSKFAAPEASWIQTPSVPILALAGLGTASSLVALATAYWVVKRRLDAPSLFWYSLGASVLATVSLWAMLGDKLPAILIP